MTESVDPWREGRQAWDRLAGWYPETPDNGGRALLALTDVGRVRRLLEQAELAAVRIARQQGKSWTDIAVSLGVTRQSAWERWRDVDEDTGARTQAAKPVGREWRKQSILDLEAALAVERAGEATIVVPDVTGIRWDDARAALHGKGLVGVGPDNVGPPLGAGNAVVVDQSPESGALAALGSSVTLWIDRGDSGVREPRRPKPEPRTGRKVRVQEED